jgi:nucleoside-diphosphate-sugar epimerase
MSERSVLVTGGAGYLGSVLIEKLQARGYRIIVFDNGITSPGFSQDFKSNNVLYLQGDVGDPADLASVLKGVDSVVHLACVVGDPACNADPDLAWTTNYLGTIYLAEACRRAGVGRFVFASSCSNYGLHVGADVDEWAPLYPQSVYAQTKIQSEHYLLSVRDEQFSPCILRFATLYGLSQRMRFDLAVNVMTIKAVLENEVIVHGGDQWRPFLHVRDAARAIMHMLETTSSYTAPEIYNCGSDSENYRLMELGRLIVREIPGSRLSIVPNEADKRSYRVSFRHIHQHLNFVCRYRVIDGIREIRAAIQAGLYHDYTLPKYHNYMLIPSRSEQKAEVVTL